MEYPNKVPPTRANLQFPMGDITEPYRHEKADEWLEKIAEYEHTRFLNTLRFDGNLVMPATADAQRTHKAAKDLCKEWDDQLTDETTQYALAGYYATRAFNMGTNFLPSAARDFSSELFQMQVEQSTRAKEFGRYAWSSMQYSHPLTYEKLSKLKSITAEKLRAYTTEERDYLQAGMAIPYLLAATDRLVSYSSNHHDFKGMVVGTEKRLMKQIQKKTFDRFFTNAIDLAPDVIIQKPEE